MIRIEENAVLTKVSDSVTSKPINFELDVQPRNWLHKYLMKLGWFAFGWFKKVYKFEVRPLTVGNMYRIAEKAIYIDDSLFSLSVERGLVEGVFSHAEAMIYILAVGIHNSKSEPPSRLKQIIRDNFTMEDMSIVIDIVFSRMDVQSFINTIVLIKGADALRKPKASPTDEGELIAPSAS